MWCGSMDAHRSCAWRRVHHGGSELFGAAHSAYTCAISNAFIWRMDDGEESTQLSAATLPTVKRARRVNYRAVFEDIMRTGSVERSCVKHGTDIAKVKSFLARHQTEPTRDDLAMVAIPWQYRATRPVEIEHLEN